MYLGDFVAGLSHPFGGADHILAMVAVGLWSAFSGGRALWVWPAAFVSMVAVGFAAAVAGVQLPLVEPAILCSIIVLGLLLALAVKAPVWLGALVVGLFALFHGHAHGTEATMAGLRLIGYATGFSFATAALHAVGLLGGLVLARSARISLLRSSGVAVAITGLALLATAS